MQQPKGSTAPKRIREARDQHKWEEKNHKMDDLQKTTNKNVPALILTTRQVSL